MTKPECNVDQYKVSITDPNGLKSVSTFENDGTTWSTVDQPLESNVGAFGVSFTPRDALNRIITIESLSFTNPDKSLYFGDYLIEVTGGVGFGSAFSYFDP